MSNNLFNQLSEQAVRERYTLLCQACESAASETHQPLEQHLKSLEDIIELELPVLARQGHPDSFTDLLQELRLEIGRFREFCEYPILSSKVVIGLGGSFSAGKSSLINALIGDRKCLVTEVDPTTSLPTYLVQGESKQTEVHAINLFNRVVPLTHEQFRTLTHEEKSIYGSQVSQQFKSAIVAHPTFPWSALALLDTPGYSKAEQSNSERTDANLARTQLNSSQFIIWLVPADKGTIPEEDIAFLATLDPSIPKLVVISRADKHPPEEISNITELVRNILACRGLSVLDVLPLSTRPRSDYSIDIVLNYFEQWSQVPCRLDFAHKFKRQFMNYQEFIDKERQRINKLFSKYNRVLTFSDDVTVIDDINSEQQACKGVLLKLDKLADDLSKVKIKFFSQLKYIGELVGVEILEPDAISLLKFDKGSLCNKIKLLDIESDKQLTAKNNSLIWSSLMVDDGAYNADEFKFIHYDKHFMAKYDEATRCYYVSLMLMVLLNNGCLSKGQQEILEKEFLPALDLTGRLAELCVMARDMLPNDIELAINKLGENSISKCLMLDVTTLSYFGGPLTSETASIISMLASLFKLNDSEMEDVAYLSSFILSLPLVHLKEPGFNTSLAEYNFWNERLYSFRPNAMRRLFNWADDNNIPSYIFPRNEDGLMMVKELSTMDDGFESLNYLPNEIYLLENLSLLTVDVINGQVPDSIGQLKNLRCLGLRSDSMNSIPDTIGNLSDLEELYLQGGFDNLPDSLFSLNKLMRLCISSPNLTSLPKLVNGLISLEELEVSIECKSLPEEMGSLRKLEKIIVSDSNSITGFEKIKLFKEDSVMFNLLMIASLLIGGWGAMIGWDYVDGFILPLLAAGAGFLLLSVGFAIMIMIIGEIFDSICNKVRYSLYLGRFDVSSKLVGELKNNNVELDVPDYIKPLFD